MENYCCCEKERPVEGRSSLMGWGAFSNDAGISLRSSSPWECSGPTSSNGGVVRDTSLMIGKQELLGSRPATPEVRIATLPMNDADEAVAYDTSQEKCPPPLPLGFSHFFFCDRWKFALPTKSMKLWRTPFVVVLTSLRGGQEEAHR